MDLTVLLKDPIRVVCRERGLLQWFTIPFFFPVVIYHNMGIPAALAMYQRARKVTTLTAELSKFVPMAELQTEAYLGAINALSLVDQKVAWIAIPLTAESDYIVCYLLEELYAPGRRDMEIISVNEIH